MPIPPLDPGAFPDRRPVIYAAWFLAAIALIYALLAGLHTLQDFDLGWQLATGRWVLQHHQIFSADVFSYTAAGAPWIYPALSGIVFYLTYLAGGYALLSWMGAAVCAATVALLIRRNHIASAALALVAVPLIASRTQPRAEMFTTLLFGAFLSLLWRHYLNGHHPAFRSNLWLLPALMIAWVNLHLGFIAGLGLCAAYLMLEVLELPFPEKRSAMRSRLRRAWPWLAMTLAATAFNPWGASIYRALARQQQAQSLHSQWVVEWQGIHPSWSSLRQALDARDPQSAFWWLAGVALLCAALALWRKRIGAAALLLASLYFSIQHVRLEALFACVAVVLGGSLLSEVWANEIWDNEIWANAESRRSPTPPLERSRKKKNTPSLQAPRRPWKPAALLLLTAALASLAAVRARDLVTNRYYLGSTQLSLFGPGISWWFPERALQFVQREKLPANIFNTYSLGGYLTWRLFPEYRDYIDSRALPFGPEIFFRAYDLSVQSPDSSLWQQEADSRDLNTIVVPLARYDGIALFPQLRAFCASPVWRPVYMDEVSAVFVRHTQQTAALVDRLQIDCDKVAFTPPQDLLAANSRGRAELFNFWANSAEILYTLGRYPEAFTNLDRAQSIFADSGHLHLLRGLALQRIGRSAEAEAELRTSLSSNPPTRPNWFSACST